MLIVDSLGINMKGKGQLGPVYKRRKLVKVKAIPLQALRVPGG
jgi:hypothetical protein